MSPDHVGFGITVQVCTLTRENLTLMHMNNKVSDQLVNLHSLIITSGSYAERVNSANKLYCAGIAVIGYIKVWK